MNVILEDQERGTRMCRIRVPCACSAILDVKASRAGTMIKCPRCQMKFQVPHLDNQSVPNEQNKLFPEIVESTRFKCEVKISAHPEANTSAANSSAKLDMLTMRQRKIYDYIQNQIEKFSQPPAIRQIGEAFGIKSPNGVITHLKALEKKGLITRDSHAARSIRLVDTVKTTNLTSSLLDPSKLTSRQLNIFNFIYNFIDSNGFSPTVREIGIEFNILSPNGVTSHIKALEDKGFVLREKGMARNITVCGRIETKEDVEKSLFDGDSTRADTEIFDNKSTPSSDKDSNSPLSQSMNNEKEEANLDSYKPIFSDPYLSTGIKIKLINEEINSLIKAVLEQLEIYGETDILGESLMAIKNFGSSKDLAKLAIISDFARVCDLVIRSATPNSSSYDTRAFPIFQKLASDLVSCGRTEYRHFNQITPQDLNEFLLVFRSDPSRFGMACIETAWSGLAICRRCVKLNFDVEILQRFIDIAKKLIDSLLGGSTVSLSIRAFELLLDESLVEYDNKKHSKVSSQHKDTLNNDPKIKAENIQSCDLNKDGIFVEWARTEQHVCITQESISLPTIFDIRELPERIHIVLNSDHPISEQLFNNQQDLVEAENGDLKPAAIYVLLEAWARLENMSGNKRRQLLQDIRLDWGRIARDII